jgi:transcriptional adapter 3
MRILAAARKNHVDEVAPESIREEEKVRTDDEEKRNKKKRKATETLAPQELKIGWCPQ